MKILMVSNFYPPYYVGAYEHWCALVAEGLHQRGHDVKVLTSRSGAPSTGPFQENIRGVKVERLLGQYQYEFRELGWACVLARKYIDRQKHDMVHEPLDGLIGVRPQLQDVRDFARAVDEFKPD